MGLGKVQHRLLTPQCRPVSTLAPRSSLWAPGGGKAWNTVWTSLCMRCPPVSPHSPLAIHYKFLAESSHWLMWQWVVSHISKCSGLVSSRRCLSLFIFQVNWLPCDFVGLIDVVNLLFLQLFPCCKRVSNALSSCLPSVALSWNIAVNSTLPSCVPSLISFALHNQPGWSTW